MIKVKDAPTNNTASLQTEKLHLPSPSRIRGGLQTAGTPLREMEIIQHAHDELEALRLCD
jgi:hypothetical protein